MTPKTNLLLEISCPPDGFTEEEDKITKLVFEHTVESLYAKLPTARMKAIVAMHFELGYTQEMVARVFGISQARINEEIGNIRKVLTGKPFRARKEKVKFKAVDLISYCYNVVKPYKGEMLST
jgi:DNA-directed RNA polymerase specialized sigma24 family protein